MAPPAPPSARFPVHENGVLCLAAGHGARSRHLFAGSLGGSLACCAIVAAPESPHVAGGGVEHRHAVLEAHQGCVWTVASGNDVLITGGVDGAVRVWAQSAAPTPANDISDAPSSAADGQYTLSCSLSCSQTGKACTVYALLMLPHDGDAGDMLLAALSDGSVQLWRATHESTGGWAHVHRCEVHAGSVLCLAAGGGMVYCGGADCAISKLQLPSGATADDSAAGLLPLKKVESAHQADIHAIALHGSGRLFSAGADAAIRVWALPQLQPLYSLRSAGRPGEALAHDGAIYALLVVPGATSSERSTSTTAARLFSASADSLIKVWDLTTMDQIATLAGHQSFVCALQANAGCLYSASSDKTLAVWSLATYEQLRVLTGHRGGLYSLAVHTGRACSGSLDGTVRVWSQLSGEGDGGIEI